MSEQEYDEEIAPLLLKAAKRCEELGYPIVAVVEYGGGERGETRFVPEEATLAMRMLSMLAGSGNNIDLFLINLLRHCNKNGISLHESMFLAKHSSVTP